MAQLVKPSPYPDILVTEPLGSDCADEQSLINEKLLLSP
jgi:hypothetical protein